MSDHAEITNLFARFARMLDEKRWDDAHTVYAPDVTTHSPRGGELHGIDDVVAYLRGSDVDGERTQHVTTNLEVVVTGDRATAVADLLVYFHRDGQAPHQTSSLREAATLVRTPAGWRIGELRLTLVWTQARA